MNLVERIKNNIEFNSIIDKLSSELAFKSTVHIECSAQNAKKLRDEGFEVVDGGQRDEGYYISFKSSNQFSDR